MASHRFSSEAREVSTSCTSEASSEGVTTMLEKFVFLNKGTAGGLKQIVGPIVKKIKTAWNINAS